MIIHRTCLCRISNILLRPRKVVARTKRIGGGFGGKETRAINLSCAAAVPAWHLRRGVRLIQDRDEDMHSSGHRHPFLGKYKVCITGFLRVSGCRVYGSHCRPMGSALPRAVRVVKPQTQTSKRLAASSAN